MKLYQDREWLYRKYWDEELNGREIGDICGVSSSNISYWMHKLNIQFRSKSEANKNPSEEIRMKMSEAHKGKHPSEETKKRMSKNHKGMEGHIQSEETREKMSISHLGGYHTKDTKERMSLAQKGHFGYTLGFHHTKETKEKLRIARLGENNPMFGKPSPFRDRYHTKESREKISFSRIGKYCGENHPNWQGGISFEPYTPEFNRQLKELIRQRDGCKCQLCGMPECENGKSLCIHHIDYIKKNCLPNNLITLCGGCNTKVNFNRGCWSEYFKEKLLQPALAI
ncbi:unnamed protein product [marine sediment metagenome]|uniref:HNH nuclease domain-containing protein n=1 Tax=marine sediment metagenome TaxID=412755 RepID=X0ZJ88_9ZZZZ